MGLAYLWAEEISRDSHGGKTRRRQSEVREGHLLAKDRGRGRNQPADPVVLDLQPPALGEQKLLFLKLR